MNKQKKIYISGCGGMLGDAFYKQFSNDYILKCTDINTDEPWLSYCDVTKRHEYLDDVQEFGADYLFHLPALTSLEYCEKHPDLAHIVNTGSVYGAVHIANKLNIPLLLVSTAGIFGGEKDVYTEHDIPSPLCIYAKTKFKAENIVLSRVSKPLVCRPSWMVGGGLKKDKMFVSMIIKQIRSGKKQLHVVNDKRGTITYTHDFAKNVRLLIEGNHTGLFNMANTGVTSRMEIATEIVKILGLTDTIEIIGVPSGYFDKTYFVNRPDSERLLNQKLDTLGLNKMRDWKIVLKEYIRTDFASDIK